MADEFCLKMPDFHVTFRDLLHAVNLRNWANGFTSLPKEGVLRIFSPWKIRRLWPGLNPRTWVPKASTLPLDHRFLCDKATVIGAAIKNKGHSSCQYFYSDHAGRCTNGNYKLCKTCLLEYSYLTFTIFNNFFFVWQTFKYINCCAIRYNFVLHILT